jgi:hypothetical protein
LTGVFSYLPFALAAAEQTLSADDIVKLDRICAAGTVVGKR